MDKPKGFICDVDGTIAYHDETMRKHYDYSLVLQDIPIRHTILIVQAVINEGIEPIFVTGRADENEGKVRSDTVYWINKYVTDVPFNLYMRPEFLLGRPDKRDFRKDFEVKEEIYRKYVEPKWDVEFALDDRLQVCQMWHRIGISLLRTGDPDAVF